MAAAFDSYTITHRYFDKKNVDISKSFTDMGKSKHISKTKYTSLVIGMIFDDFMRIRN